MILQKLRIEHFKRLHDVEIVFPSIGIIGVVGANGAGKSTLFEAILWALFRPNAIGIDNRDVVPRRSVGVTTKVELTIETDDTVYTISRSLRITAGGSQRAEASIFKGDEQEPLVTGANPVSDFVRGTLLRMSSQSFTTTFFTRQKELAFFGEMGDTERRREMQRLLDMDAIERAQARLREDRNRERGALVARTAQLGEENAARDLDAERDGRRAAEAEVAARVATLTEEHERLSADYDLRATRMESLRALQRQYEALQAERRAAETAQVAARATHDDAIRRIALLHDRQRRATEIAPALAALPTVEAALHDADAAALHAQRVAESTRDVREAENAVAQLYTATDAMTADLDALRDLLFDWETLEEEPPGLARARALAAKLAAAAPMTVERVKERDALRALIRLADDARRAADDATSRTGKRAELDARLAVVSAGHDPADARRSTRTRGARPHRQRGAPGDGNHRIARRAWQVRRADEAVGGGRTRRRVPDLRSTLHRCRLGHHVRLPAPLDGGLHGSGKEVNAHLEDGARRGPQRQRRAATGARAAATGPDDHRPTRAGR